MTEYVKEIIDYGDDLAKISLNDMRGIFKAVQLWREHLVQNDKPTELPVDHEAEMAKHFAHFMQVWKAFRHALPLIALTGEDKGYTNDLIKTVSHLYEYVTQCAELAEMLDENDNGDGQEDRTDFMELAKRNRIDFSIDPQSFIEIMFHGFSVLEDNLNALKKHFEL